VSYRAISSNFAFSAYQARTNLRDRFLSGSHLLCYFQEACIRKIGPKKVMVFLVIGKTGTSEPFLGRNFFPCLQGLTSSALVSMVLEGIFERSHLY